MTALTKKCKNCNIEKDLSEYSSRLATCKKCKREMNTVERSKYL